MEAYFSIKGSSLFPIDQTVYHRSPHCGSGDDIGTVRGYVLDKTVFPHQQSIIVETSNGERQFWKPDEVTLTWDEEL